MNSRKRFDPDDGKYGEEGEIAVARALTNSGYEVQHLPSGQYGPDLLVRSKAGEVFGVEVERRKGSSWRGGTFPYPEYNYPERRLKKMRAGDLLFVVSGGCEDALIIFGKDAVELLETVPGEFQTNRYGTRTDLETRRSAVPPRQAKRTTPRLAGVAGGEAQIEDIRNAPTLTELK